MIAKDKDFSTRPVEKSLAKDLLQAYRTNNLHTVLDQEIRIRPRKY